jgi:transcriptional regulator with XRE-family HTH domain
MSSAQVAQHLGVSAHTIRNWEAGLYVPDGSKVVRMSQLYGCSPDYLLGMTDERNHQKPG